MTKLVILEYPDPRLRKEAAPVAAVDDALRQFIDDLLETMYAHNGVGLAATQVDVHKRVIVLDVSETRDRPLVLINPEILSKEGEAPARRDACRSPASTISYRAQRVSAYARWGRTVSRSRWMRKDCSVFASNMRWTISKASYLSITSLSSSAR